MHDPDEEPLPPDEPSWARRVRAGDVAALEEAFRACYANMCGFVRAQVASADTAEDLVQDVFMRVWQTRNRLDPNGSLRSLLYRAAHNAALNFLKHRNVESRWLHTATTSTAGLAVGGDDPAAFKELAGAVDHALAALPERCRLIFIMSRQQGLSYAEIAETLDLSVKTVETQMGRALKALRSALSAFIA
jgi:RNA polymerase sigma-70 factor (ECF subfamily)